MNNQNKEINKAQLIVRRHYHYSADPRNSEFAGLRGDIQGAIMREAEFRVKTLALTDGFSEILIPEADKMQTAKDKSQTLFEIYCEYFAHQGNQELSKSNGFQSKTFEMLKQRDSDAIYQYTPAFNPPYQQDKAFRKAKHNNEAIRKKLEKGEKQDPQTELNRLIEKLQTR